MPEAEKTAVEESVVAAMDDTVKNPGNMKPRRVAMLDMAEKEGKKKVSGVTMEMPKWI